MASCEKRAIAGELVLGTNNNRLSIGQGME